MVLCPLYPCPKSSDVSRCLSPLPLPVRALEITVPDTGSGRFAVRFGRLTALTIGSYCGYEPGGFKDCPSSFPAVFIILVHVVNVSILVLWFPAIIRYRRRLFGSEHFFQ